MPVPAHLYAMPPFGTSSSRTRLPARLPESIGDYPLGRHTGLPLIICPECHSARVLELVVQIEDNGNKGRVFFKCPKKVKGLEGVPGCCGFYEFQREYLAILVQQGKVVMALGQNDGEQEGHSAAAAGGPRNAVAVPPPVEKNPMEAKMEALISAVKGLTMAMAAVVVVGAMYLFN